jgi:hypothetical protein
VSRRARHADGGAPTTRRNSVLKCCGDAHPTSYAISVNDDSLSTSNRFASRTRAASSSP